MATKTRLTKNDLYRVLSSDPAYRSVSWIANVLFTGCGRPTTRLRALKALVDEGREVAPLDFIMPYEGIRVDGVALATRPLLDEGREVPYSKDWWKA